MTEISDQRHSIYGYASEGVGYGGYRNFIATVLSWAFYLEYVHHAPLNITIQTMPHKGGAYRVS